ncbi:MAG: PAS domain S-box protein [Pseudomonadota bacterium]
MEWQHTSSQSWRTRQPYTARSRAVSAERHFKETLNKAAVGVLLTSEVGRFLSVNRMFADMLGYAPEELEGESFRTFSAPEDLPTNAHRRSALWSGDVERVVAEKRWVHRAGHRVWTRMTISISRELAASEPFSIAIVEDITAAKQIEEAQRLLVGELNHRVKNTLAVVQGMIKRTLANTPDPQTFASLIEGRLQSISMAHDLLSQSDWRDLDLMRLFNRAVLQVFPAHASAFVFDCEPVDLAPHQTTTLALIFHELTTNAIKHGALSTSRGRVHLSAKRREIAPTNETSQPTETLCIVWEEVGGPVITDTPDRKGFGSFLLNRGIAHSLGGKATHHFARTGLVVRAELPLATPVSADDTAQRSQPTPQSVETVKPTGQTPHQRITGQSLL